MKRDNKGEHGFKYGYGLDVEKGPYLHAFEVNTIWRLVKFKMVF